MNVSTFRSPTIFLPTERRLRLPVIPSTPVVSVSSAIRLEAQAFFEKMDTDHSGTLDLYQFILALQLSGSVCTSGQYEAFFNGVDSDGSGRVTLQEWIVAFSHLKRAGVDGAISWSETKQNHLEERQREIHRNANFAENPSRWFRPGGRLLPQSPKSRGGMFPGAHRPHVSAKSLALTERARREKSLQSLSPRSPRWVPGQPSALVHPLSSRLVSEEHYRTILALLLALALFLQPVSLSVAQLPAVVPSDRSPLEAVGTLP
eukprot:COSAG05_NODE_3361_length_2117_cov_1.666006_4_plen_261_part_00